MTSETTPALVRKLMSRQDLTRAESAELLEDLLRHDTEGWKLLAFSVASQTKGETVDELLGIWDAMHRLTGDYDLDLKGRRPMEVASAGSSGVRKINVSTLMALVVGEPAVPVLEVCVARRVHVGTGLFGELAAAAHEVGVQVRFQPGDETQPETVGQLEVLVDVAARVDRRCEPVAHLDEV